MEPKQQLETLNILQSMITLAAERLDGLRSQCSISSEITQQEIRTLEGKLIKLFSKQLLIKEKLSRSSDDQIPSLKLWLQIVGLNQELILVIYQRYDKCLESLLRIEELELKEWLDSLGKVYCSDEELRRLIKSLYNLKKYSDLLHDQEGETSLTTDSNDLYWDSWDMNKLQTSSPRIQPRRRVSNSEQEIRNPTIITRNNNHSLSHQNSIDPMTTCSTTPCTPVTTKAPSMSTLTSYNSSSTSPCSGSHPDIYYNTSTNSSYVSVFSPANSSTNSPISPPPPTTPPVVPTTTVKKNVVVAMENGKKFPTTPPAKKKHQTLSTTSSKQQQQQEPKRLTTPTTTGCSSTENFPLTKSKSHESQLANRIDQSSSENNLMSQKLYSTPKNSILHGSYLTSLDTTTQHKRRERLPTEPGPNTSPMSTPQHASPIKSPPPITNTIVPPDEDHVDGTLKTTLQVPKSPRTPTLPRSMGHVISHRFTKMFKVSTCDYCSKQVIIGLKCKECKYKCHRDCEPKVPPSCGLPPEYVNVFIQSLTDGDSPVIPSHRSSPVNWGRRRRRKPTTNANQESSSNTSSCNSSTPSSPALFNNSTTTLQKTTQHLSISAQSTPSYQSHLFSFPEIVPPFKPTAAQQQLANSMGELVSTVKSNDSDRTYKSGTSGSTDSERTLALRVDSQDSQMSDSEFLNNTSFDKTNSWPRQNSINQRSSEWDIPFDELKLGDKIGTGHFGTVFRGSWHGDVAIKVLDLFNEKTNEKSLEQFKQEVSIFRKTRHENLILFMGACMKPPKLAIVTSLCKGKTLYTHLQLRKDKFNINKIVLIAQQMSQGMSYLHSRGIIHKDLKSKNVFLESGKVVITDFGLFSVSKLCHNTIDGSLNEDYLNIPPGWLCYLAPEVMRALKPCPLDTEDLPFSKASDIYAFGTIWYELLVGEWPYKFLSPETIIWQVCSGLRQPLPSTIFSRDVKEILLNCWTATPTDRPDFSHLFKALEKLPKKRLARSPSHPVHLSRSAESVF